MNAISKSTSGHPFEGLRVIELSDLPSGEMLGQIFADLGGDIVKLEQTGGGRSRHVGPYVGNKADPEQSLNYWYYNTNKKSVELDITDREGRTHFDRLLKDADILITSFQPHELKAKGVDYNALLAAHPTLIIVSLTPFGLTGPWADYMTSDLVSFAISGALFCCGYDDHSIPPIKPGGPQSYHAGTSHGHNAAMLALIERQNTGKGQLLDISLHEACAGLVEVAFPYWVYSQTNIIRQTCRSALTVRTQPAIFLCGDGKYVYLIIILAETKAWNSLVGWLDSKGLAADLTDPKYGELVYRQENFDHIQGIIEAFCLMHEANQVFEEGQAFNLPVGVLNAPEDLYTNEHFAAREYFQPVHYEEVGDIPYPGFTVTFSDLKRVERVRAPALGQHNAEILGEKVD